MYCLVEVFVCNFTEQYQPRISYAEVVSLNEATRPLSFQIFTLALAITLCFTVYTEGANVTSPTPASVSTKTTKVVTVTTPSVTNLSSEPASKTIHVSPTKVYALRPQDPSPSNSLTTYTMEHNAPPPSLFTKARQR